MSENIRNRNGKAFNFINGLKVKNVNIEGPMGSTMIGYNGTTVKQALDNVGLSITQNNNEIISLNTNKADKTQITTLEQSKADAVAVNQQLTLKADIESPAFTGIPTAPTPSLGDDSGKLATTEFVKQTLDNNVTEVINGGTGASNAEDARDNLDVYSKSESDSIFPAGMITYSASSNVPVGWLTANGSGVSRTQFARLFLAIGTTYGSGDGVNTFNLPDLRGEFIRGLDLNRGIDPDRILGSYQLDMFKSHNHTAGSSAGGTSTVENTMQQSANGNDDPTGAFVNNTGGTETRPRNIALVALIKT